MKKIATGVIAVVIAGSLTGCMGPQVPCPGLSQNPDGSHTISAPTGKAAEDPSLLAGCEYEYDEDGNLGTERDTDG